MRSPGLALAWEFRQRHPLLALSAYLLALGTVRLLFLKPGQPFTLDPPDGRAAVVIVPLSMTFIYLLAVFSFGLAGDLGARSSIYPARLFTLPVTTPALVGWPMLYGAAAMASLWIATALFARWALDIDAPLLWPALLAAAFLAWTQALMWLSYGLPGLRVIVTVLWLAALDTILLVALHFKVSEASMAAFLAPQIPCAYLAACVAVARARRGDVPDWRGDGRGVWKGWFARRGQLADVLPRRRDPFPSPGRAQLWFEWRRHGRSLPVWVGILLPFELAFLFVTPELVFHTLLAVLLTPPLVACFTGASVSRSNPSARDPHGLTPFVATRPLTSAALVAAKLKMALGSTLAAWLLVLVATPLALHLSGTAPEVLDRARQGIEIVGTPRAVAIALLAFSALLASTWKQLVRGLYLGLTGRTGLIRASVLLTLSFLVVVGPLAQWILERRQVVAVLWNALPWIAAVLAGLKLCAAAWVALRLRDRRLLGDRALLLGAASWDVVVFALFGLLVWLAPALLFRGYLLALVAILEVPLARLAAAPLALAWNRHR